MANAIRQIWSEMTEPDVSGEVLVKAAIPAFAARMP
jgi:hypothetical protein